MNNSGSALSKSPRERGTPPERSARHLEVVPDAPETRADRSAKRDGGKRIALPVLAGLTMVALLEVTSTSWAALLVLVAAFGLLGFASVRSGRDSSDGLNWRTDV